MRIFREKTVKSLQRPGLCPRIPVSLGGWGLRPQTHALLLPFIDIDLSKCVSSIKPIFYYFEKQHKSSIQQMLCFCFFRAFVLIFYLKL